MDSKPIWCQSLYCSIIYYLHCCNLFSFFANQLHCWFHSSYAIHKNLVLRHLYLFMLFSFTFGGRIPHPPFVLLFLSIYSCVVSYKKKKKNLHSTNMVDQISTQNPANNSSKSLKGEQVLPSEILEILRNNLIFYARSLEKMRRLSILLPLYLLNLEYYFKFKLLDHWFRSHWLHDQRLKLFYFLWTMLW